VPKKGGKHLARNGPFKTGRGADQAPQGKGGGVCPARKEVGVTNRMWVWGVKNSGEPKTWAFEKKGEDGNAEGERATN